MVFGGFDSSVLMVDFSVFVDPARYFLGMGKLSYMFLFVCFYKAQSGGRVGV